MMDLPDIANKNSFWAYAKCTNTLRPHDPGTTKYSQIVEILTGSKKRLIKVRHYKNETGETRRTIEVEI